MSYDQQAADIQARIAEVRESLDVDVHRIRSSASAMTDWRYYPRRFPWVTLGLTAAAGYLIVPSRNHRDSLPSELSDEEQRGGNRKRKSKAVKGITAYFTSMLAAGLMRAGSAYVGRVLSGTEPGSTTVQDIRANGRANAEY